MMNLCSCCRALTRSVPHHLCGAWRNCFSANASVRVSESQSVMLDLVEDALKDAHDASLLSAYAASGLLPDSSTLQ